VKILRSTAQIKHMKEPKRMGLNQASGNFPAGSNVRIKNKRK
jgi:hypothetical protein